ncbi:MAG: hypothetical protein ACYTF0_00995, partial [Planctomycetota bacterium]
MTLPLSRTLGLVAALGACSLPAVDLGGVDIHGFVSQGYINSQENNFLVSTSTDGSFEFNEVGINFALDASDNLRVGIQLFARDLGEYGNNDLGIDWAYGDYRVNDQLGVRVGRIIRPAGLYTETKDFDFLRTAAILPASVYDPAFREVNASINGASVYGNVDLDSAGALAYHSGIGGIDLSDDGDTEIILSSQPIILPNGNIFQISDLTDIQLQHAFFLSLDYESPIDGLRGILSWSHFENLELTTLGSSGFLNGEIDAVRDIDWINFGVQYVVNEWTFDLEYFRQMTNSKINGNASGDPDGAGPAPTVSIAIANESDV